MKFLTGTKPKLVINERNKIEQNGIKLLNPYCSLLWRSVNNCKILHKSVNSRYSAKYCLIPETHFCLKKFPYVWWVGLRLKIGHFEAKMPLCCLHKMTNISQDFVKTLNRTLWPKPNSF
jgi:hypothetical protein